MHGQESTKYPIRSDVPQGGIPGPILSYIYVNGFIDTVAETGAYADNVTACLIKPSRVSDGGSYMAKST